MRIPTIAPRLTATDTRRVKPPPKTEKRADPFYSSRQWLATRDTVRREARGVCQALGCTKPGLYVDHIVEIRDGGNRLDRANLMLMCASCHQRKTNREKGRRISR